VLAAGPVSLKWFPLVMVQATNMVGRGLAKENSAAADETGRFAQRGEESW
jgi:hypothetical protein